MGKTPLLQNHCTHTNTIILTKACLSYSNEIDSFMMMMMMTHICEIAWAWACALVPFWEFYKLVDIHFSNKISWPQKKKKKRLTENKNWIFQIKNTFIKCRFVCICWMSIDDYWTTRTTTRTTKNHTHNTSHGNRRMCFFFHTLYKLNVYQRQWTVRIISNRFGCHVRKFDYVQRQRMPRLNEMVLFPFALDD